MATATKVIGGDGVQFTIYMNYDDTTLRPTGVRADLTNCPFDVYVELVQGDGTTNAGRKHGATFLKNTDTNIVIPTTNAQRLQLTLRADGRLDGVYKNIVPQG